MSKLPEDLDQAIEQAKEATRAAIQAGYARLQVELVFPELKVMPVAKKFLPVFQDMGLQFKVYFPDAGAAALARRDWGEQPFTVRGMGELQGQMEPDDEAFLMVEPSAIEVKEVEQLCNSAAARPFVMLNPRLEDISVVGIGYAARQLRERFVSQFDSCYYLRPAEGYVLYRCYPSPWQVWLEAKSGDYELVAEETTRPNGEMVDQILTQATGDTKDSSVPTRKGFLGGLQDFLRALNQ